MPRCCKGSASRRHRKKAREELRRNTYKEQTKLREEAQIMIQWHHTFKQQCIDPHVILTNLDWSGLARPLQPISDGEVFFVVAIFVAVYSFIKYMKM
jgi:hypothetical protein